MICAILVKYSFKNHEFIVAFSWCIVYYVAEPAILLQICNV